MLVVPIFAEEVDRTVERNILGLIAMVIRVKHCGLVVV